MITVTPPSSAIFAPSRLITPNWHQRQPVVQVGEWSRRADGRHDGRAPGRAQRREHHDAEADHDQRRRGKHARIGPGDRVLLWVEQGGQGHPVIAANLTRIIFDISDHLTWISVCYWSPARTDVMRCVLKPSQCIRPR